MKKFLKIDYIMFMLSIVLGLVTLLLVFVIDDLYSSFNILMAFVFLALCFVPMLLKIVFRWKAPSYITVVYFVFIILSTLLGTIYGLYNYFVAYDIILHALSSVLLAGFGLYFYTRWQKEKSIRVACFFALGIALLGGVVWEFWEFFSDEILLLNSQRHTALDGSALIGHEAVRDTMYDLLSDFVGGVVFVVGYIIYAIRAGKKNDKRDQNIKKSDE